MFDLRDDVRSGTETDEGKSPREDLRRGDWFVWDLGVGERGSGKKTFNFQQTEASKY